MQAEKYLIDKATCVVIKEGSVLTSEKTGIAPVLDWINEGVDLRGAEVADKIVGKAAAMLFVKAGISKVFAKVLSSSGKAYLDRYGIEVSWETLTDVIINRKGTGMCPMEQTVLEISDCEEGYKALMAAVYGKYN